MQRNSVTEFVGKLKTLISVGVSYEGDLFEERDGEMERKRISFQYNLKR